MSSRKRRCSLGIPQGARRLYTGWTPVIAYEMFVVMLLDRKDGVIGLNLVSVGSLSASVVHPREVFKPAILSNASSVLLCHNHPSGDPYPSQEDRALTVRLAQAGKLLGIEILDHIIVGDGKCFSFMDEGLLARG